MEKCKRILIFFILPNLAFLTMAFLTKNTQLIGMFNVVNLTLASMVAVAFLPVVKDVLWSDRKIDHADLLGLGIFLGWSSTIILRLYSIVWRWLGQPQWLTDSDILNFGLMLQFCAGILHLLAPTAINDRIPSKQWIKIGFAVGASVFTALVLAYFFDALAIEPQTLPLR